MAVDKLVDSTQLDADLTSVANAIRTKGGTSAQLAFPAGFVSAVEAIPTGGGGGGYPSLSSMDVSNNNTIWALYGNGARNGFCLINAQSSSICTIDTGYIMGNNFTAVKSENFSMTHDYDFYARSFSDIDQDYVVLRITSASPIVRLNVYSSGYREIGTDHRTFDSQNIEEIYASLSGLTAAQFRYSLIQKFTLLSSSLTGNLSYAFGTCKRLAAFSVAYGSGITNISNFMNGCSSIDEIDLSNADLSGITSATNAASAFANCINVKKIKMPASLAFIGGSMFNEDRNCKEYHFASATPPSMANTNAFNGIQNGTIIYVPYSADHSILEAYKTATNWSTYESYIEEEPQ